MKEVALESNWFQKVPYCPSCELILDVELKCPSCLSLYSKTDVYKKGNFFVLMDIRKQLLTLLENSTVTEALLKSLRNVESKFSYGCVKSGLGFQKVKKSSNDITCTFNTDGVPLFNSSNYSIWPVLISVNDLPFYLRKKFVLMGGIWFGSSKPNISIFLPRIVNEMNSLGDVPIVWKTSEGLSMHSKVFFIQCSVDAPARAMLQGHKQFNGKHGCNWCRNPGISIEKGRGHCRVYEMSKSTGWKLRESEVYAQNAKNGKFKKGQKVESPLLKLVNFDIVNGFSVDYMHCVFLGIVRALTNKWMNEKKTDWYIGKEISLIDTHLLKIKVPHEIVRSSRSIETRVHWKASEWRTWLCIVPIVLEKILPSCYLEHFSLLSRSIFLLSKPTVSTNDIDESEILINNFLKQGGTLYGVEFYSFNVHQLDHLCDTVKNWGPLWNSSAFQFESFNGKLLNYVKCANGVAVQIVNKFVNEFQIGCLCLNSKWKSNNLFERSNFPKYGIVKQKQVVGLNDYFKNYVPGQEIINVCSGKVATIKYHQFRCKSSEKRCDNIFFVEDRVFGVVRKFFKISAKHKDNNLNDNYFAQLETFNVIGMANNPQICYCSINVKKSIRFLRFEDLVMKKFYIFNVHDKDYFIEIPNLFEIN